MCVNIIQFVLFGQPLSLFSLSWLPWLPLHILLCMKILFDVHLFLWKQWCHWYGWVMRESIMECWILIFLLVIKCIIKLHFLIRQLDFCFPFDVVMKLHFPLFIDLLEYNDFKHWNTAHLLLMICGHKFNTDTYNS